MIAIGLGANLSSPRYGGPREACEAALDALRAAGIEVPAPFALVPQRASAGLGPALVRQRRGRGPTGLSAAELLDLLHGIEREMGRERRVRDEARVIDLDLLIYGETLSGPGETPILPHPRLAERAFVVLPLTELAPDWRHPGSGQSLQEMIRALPADQRAEAIE